MSTQVVFWLVALIVFALLEAATVSLASLWFCGGAVVALVEAALEVPLLWQFVSFVVVSAILLACLRPMAKKLMTPRHEPTNADRILGCRAVVTEAIDPLQGTGAVRINGVEWTATCDAPVSAGSVVQVQRIEGVKVIVTPETAAVS